MTDSPGLQRPGDLYGDSPGVGTDLAVEGAGPKASTATTSHGQLTDHFLTVVRSNSLLGTIEGVATSMGVASVSVDANG
jgi:hypothetical protein